MESKREVDLKKSRRKREDVSLELDRLPPHSTEAEQGLLGCCLMESSSCIDYTLEHLDGKSEAFYDLRHQTIFKCMQEMTEARKTVDLITLQQKLKDQELLDQVGGIPYLSELQDIFVSAANVSVYCEIVKEKFLLRELLKTCGNIIGKVHTESVSVDSLMDEAEKEVLSIRNVYGHKEVQTNSQAIAKLQEMYDLAATNKRPIGLLTGLPDLDRVTGGLMGQQMIVIAGNTSTGKTSLAMDIAEYQLHAGDPVGVFSGEMSRDELIHRMACKLAEVNGADILAGEAKDGDIRKVAKAMGTIVKLPLHIDDEGGYTIGKIAARARRMKQRYGIKLLIIDYLQLVRYGHKVSSMREDVTYVSNGIKQLAKELHIPIIVLSQLNRDNSKGGRPPALHDLRESGSIEQDADKVILLHNESDEDEENETIEVAAIVGKNRGARCRTVHLLFRKKFTRFECKAREENE